VLVALGGSPQDSYYIVIEDSVLEYGPTFCILEEYRVTGTNGPNQRIMIPFFMGQP